MKILVLLFSVMFIKLAYTTDKCLTVLNEQEYTFKNVITGGIGFDSFGDMYGLNCDIHVKYNVKSGETVKKVSGWPDGWRTAVTINYLATKDTVEIYFKVKWYNEEHPELYNPKEDNTSSRQLKFFKKHGELYVLQSYSLNNDEHNISLFKMTPKNR